jgi:hypothetical protein
MKAPPAKKPKAKPHRPDTSNLDLDPDAWPKFENLVKAAAKLGSKPHDAKKSKRKITH